VTTDRTGELVLSAGTKQIDHTSPFGDRWGGWYVTGTHGRMEHLGNRTARGTRRPTGGFREGDGPETRKVTDLRGWFDVADYLTPRTSWP
jgi:hypothetical protein